MEGADLAEGGPRDPQKVAEQLRSPTKFNPRSIMPPVPATLSGADFQALVAFVSSIDKSFQMPSEVPTVGPTKPLSHYEENWFANHKYEVHKAPTICAQCHKPSFCQSCHRNRRPDSHLHDWLKYHTGTARERPEYCQVCHEQSFCDSCHGKLLHTGDWPTRHSQVAEQDGSVCVQCHRPTQCTACHEGARPASHSRKDWVQSHSGAKPAECQTCHRESFCTECHHGAEPRSHDATWVARHGAAAKPNPKECATCHAVQFCRDCHGGLDLPHPGNWVIAHKDQASFAPGSVCYRCHDYGKVCSACHGETPPTPSQSQPAP